MIWELSPRTLDRYHKLLGKSERRVHTVRGHLRQWGGKPSKQLVVPGHLWLTTDRL